MKRLIMDHLKASTTNYIKDYTISNWRWYIVKPLDSFIKLTAHDSKLVCRFIGMKVKFTSLDISELPINFMHSPRSSLTDVGIENDIGSTTPVRFCITKE